MAAQSIVDGETGDLPSLPFSDSLWNRIAEQLRLSPQQKRIVELILRKQQDKEIAARIDLQLPTVRTYLRRIFHSTQTAGRLDLVLLILKIALEMPPEDETSGDDIADDVTPRAVLRRKNSQVNS